ncbi:ABC transporter permease [Aeromicrobium endophyticum]|uniref:ABC transporter permease n=1 Tax=Aeromicrobium endophyticum TaxID=2292704 RepID=A0A371P4T2_9ACTN|nr:ABC transporter permease [Aeromicrobium endophyticum]
MPKRARRRRRSASVVLAAAFVLLVTVLAVAGQLFTPADPDKQSLLDAAKGPSSGHLLGTDDLGRDVLSRLMQGTLSAVSGPVCVALGTMVLGTALGLLAGYYGGRVDALVTLLSDVLYSLPFMLIAIVVVGVVGTGYWLTVALLIALMFPFALRLVRSATRVQSRLPYVEAARTLGVPDRRVVTHHVLPNVSPIIVANILLDFVTAIIAFSALTFLGLGSRAGSSDWGTMLADGQKLIYDNPWMAIVPALLIALTCISATVLGDWFYDRLSARSEER